MPKIKDEIIELATGSFDHKDGVRNPEPKSNKGAVLFRIYYWQELSKIASERLKASWEEAQDGKLLKDDDFYRAKGGEFIAAESNHFSCLMKVSNPRKTFDKEGFLKAVSKQYKVPIADLEELWEEKQKDGTASLTKRVLEV